MEFINTEVIENTDAKAFQNNHPYPWISIPNFLYEEKYQELVNTLPEASLFTENFGKKRKFGQKSHDRLSLEYDANLPLSPAWSAFIKELQSESYKKFIQKMAGIKQLEIKLHWHYTPNGCSVSPHCDANRKIGSHIFYFNTEKDWDPSWGGDTLILDDNGKFSRNSNPKFSDFHSYQRANALGNNSLLFIRNGNSWHGVEEINCPQGKYRKVLIVVINKMKISRKIKKFFFPGH